MIGPKIGDTHWSWTGEEWIPCVVHKLSPSGKSFMAYNEERQYGSYAFKPNREFRPEPTHPQAEVTPAPLFS